MQDSPAAILQSANLFVFTMNNPVRFTDPSGLVARDMFSMSPNELRAAGISFGTTGSVSQGTFRVNTIHMGGTTIRSGGDGTIRVGNSAPIIGGLVLGTSATSDTRGAMGEFTSLNNAARAFARYTNEMSIQRNWEFGTYFYSWTERRFVRVSSMPPMAFRRTVTLYSFTAPHTDRLRDQVSFNGINPPIPAGTTWEATGHTHGAWDHRDVHSGRDWNDRISRMDRNMGRLTGLPVYVVTPNGRVSVHDPNSFTRNPIVALPWTMPFDPNHPNRPFWAR